MDSPPSRPRPSSNWLALKKKISAHDRAGRKHTADSSASVGPSKRRRLTAGGSEASINGEMDAVDAYGASSSKTQFVSMTSGPSAKHGDSLFLLRQMIVGEQEYTESERLPGKYLALDCEMVGVGPEGKESSLARVSIVNYHGAIQLDVFVRQRERVVDYRTEFSGIRPADMASAKPFDEVQTQVAELLRDRILVGHAVHNDLKALLLSHPRAQTRDTQYYAAKHKVTKSNRPALRNLVKQEVGVVIQSGEHSSVTDARATMAVYRLHRKEWEKGQRPPLVSTSATSGKTHRNTAPVTADEARDSDSSDGDDGETKRASPKSKDKGKGKAKGKQSFPGGGRKGVSSGLSVVVKRRGERDRNRGGSESGGGQKIKSEWWKDLGGSLAAGNGKGSKGSMKLKLG